jgi:nicotinamidase-related amidase
VVVKESDIQILKGQDRWVESYSGFGSELEETGLEKTLKEKGVSTVYCCGLAYDYCVGSTAESAAVAGFKTYLLTDASKSVAEGSALGMKERIVSAGVIEISSD